MGVHTIIQAWFLVGPIFFQIQISKTAKNGCREWLSLRCVLYSSKTERESQKKNTSWNNNRSSSGSWRAASGSEDNANKAESPFRSWNKKEQLKKEKQEKVIIKPHCEL